MLIGHSPLTSFPMEWYSVAQVCLYKISKCRETCFCELGTLALKAKRYFSTVRAEQFQPQTCPKNTLVDFSLYYNNYFGHFFFLIFENKQKTNLLCHFLLGSHLTVQFHLIREVTGMELKTQRTLSPDCFSPVMVQCVLKVFIHL